jgi:hypothetical protein
MRKKYWSENLKRKTPLGRSSRRLEDNIRMDPREIEWEDVCWTYLAEDKDHWRALVNMVMNIWVS